MNLHKLLMGDRWADLPAQTVLDDKVSKYIGNTILVLGVGLFVSVHLNIHQRNKITSLSE